MTIGKHRGALPLVAAAAGLLVACQAASFAELSGGSEGGRPHGHGRGNTHGDVNHEDHESGAEVAHASGDAPRVAFPVKEASFGEVAQGEKVHHVFKVRNEGKGVLHIKRVRGS